MLHYLKCALCTSVLSGTSHEWTNRCYILEGAYRKATVKEAMGIKNWEPVLSTVSLWARHLNSHRLSFLLCTALVVTALGNCLHRHDNVQPLVNLFKFHGNGVASCGGISSL